MTVASPCRKCGRLQDPEDQKFCPGCGTPTAVDFSIPHADAVREYEHHESILQNYRAMFLVSETFLASIAASRLYVATSETLITLLAVFGVAWLGVWVIATTLRAKVVRFFEEHDEDGALLRYHNDVERAAHLAGFWFFTVAFPASFALFWVALLLLTYHVV